MDYFEEQREEIESLKSIFPEEFAELSACPPCFMVRIDDIPTSTPLQMKITFPGKYPDEVPVIEIPNRSNALPTDMARELVGYLRSAAESSLGIAMVFTLLSEARDWINDNAERITKQNEIATEEAIDNDDDDNEDDDKFVDRPGHSKRGGRWDYVIGLIGKPSAGKSTFFNAATQQNFAKIAAHPFTTIEPNIGKGFYSIPCPCSSYPQHCHAAYGHAADGGRYVPVLLKDVAGLVPGACEGRGKGNKFLNDLLDADVLIHVIDASGETDENGKETSGYDPTLDVEWLYQELHHWIADNILNKWDSICKKPSKLCSMFTGYHASQSLIQDIFIAAGITEKKLKALFSLNKEDSESLVNKLVTEFLKLRFPILLALNKIDRPDAKKNIEKFQEKFKGMPMITVSARSEFFLQERNKEGVLCYKEGASDFHILNEISPDESTPNQTVHLETAENIRKYVLVPYGGTGVLRALSEAVHLRQPIYAFPVRSLDTLESINLESTREPAVLRDCVVLKQGSTVGKLFTIMCYPPVNLLTGDYVRAECIDDACKKRVLHKDDIIDDANNIIKIMSTKKASAPSKQRN